jgi:hypothetical protein
MFLAEHQHIMQALAFTSGQIEGDGGAAALLGLRPSTLRTTSPTISNRNTLLDDAAIALMAEKGVWLSSQTLVRDTPSADEVPFLETFKEFPPRQKAASFTMDQALEKMESASVALHTERTWGGTKMSQPDDIRREVLPIPDRKPVALTTYTAKDPDTKFPPIRLLRPPAGAPNALVVLIDDAGFGSSTAFGGPCQTPTAERLAKGGLKYTRFHTTALCSPTRAALLTGRNHHAVGMGGITEIATSAPGYNSLRPNTCAPLAEVLKLNGYSTAQFGKCHEVPVFESTPVGPYDRWPTGSGFERFYGFIGGETSQYAPPLYDGTTPVQASRTAEEGYHLTEDLADRTIDYIR